MVQCMNQGVVKVQVCLWSNKGGSYIITFFFLFDTNLFKGSMATNEQQDDGTGGLHQVAQHPIDQVYLYTGCPCPSLPTQDPERDKVLAAEQVGLYAPLNPHLMLRELLKLVGNE